MTPAQLFASAKKEKVRRGKKISINCNLKELRESLKLTCSEVAKNCNLAPATIVTAEDGQSLPLTSALRITKFFGCKVEDIWSLPGERNEK